MVVMDPPICHLVVRGPHGAAFSCYDELRIACQQKPTILGSWLLLPRYSTVTSHDLAMFRVFLSTASGFNHTHV